jgi:hypothetical protein
VPSTLATRSTDKAAASCLTAAGFTVPERQLALDSRWRAGTTHRADITTSFGVAGRSPRLRAFSPGFEATPLSLALHDLGMPSQRERNTVLARPYALDLHVGDVGVFDGAAGVGDGAYLGRMVGCLVTRAS